MNLFRILNGAARCFLGLAVKILTTSGILFVCFQTLAMAAAMPSASARPNIVVVLVDDAAFMDFGLYGGEAHTPNIDKLGAMGTMFTGYRSSPLCAPSRAMLLTGTDNHLNGVATIAEIIPPQQVNKPGYGLSLEPGVMTIADYLKKAGYRTLMTGKWHLGSQAGELPDSHGFDRSFALDASGADNWESKSYMPFYDRAPWYEDGKPVGVTSVVLSHQHLDPSLSSDDIRAIAEPYIREVLPEGWLSNETEWWVNPTGTFVIGGPDGDAGLTGRKIIVDTYGGAAPHGGGAFSGKDPTKVDRSAAYAARYLAKNVVAAGLAEKCTIQIAYAIGVAQPVSVYVNLHDTGKNVTEVEVEKAIRTNMDLSPTGIRRHLDLNKPIYAKTSSYGHFGRKPGRDGSFSWEKTDLAPKLKAAVKNG